MELGQLALDGPNLDVLLSEAVAGLARGLETDFARVMELDAASDRLTLRAGHGCWPEERGMDRGGRGLGLACGAPRSLQGNRSSSTTSGQTRACRPGPPPRTGRRQRPERGLARPRPAVRHTGSFQHPYANVLT